ncbi:hypothetical protein ACKWTF_015564 [Chironomus riparius]
MILQGFMLVLLSLSALFNDSMSATTSCNYYKADWAAAGDVYICDVQNKLLMITKESAVISSVTGDHMVSKDSSDVTGFIAKNNTVHYFPRNIANFYVNIKAIAIFHGRIKEIQQSDVKPFLKLVELNLFNNNIEVLDDNLFDYNSKLKYVEFSYNRIFYISSKIFDVLKNLVFLKLYDNICINKASTDSINSTILINEVKEKCHNFDILNIESDLQQLENSLVCVNSETSSIFSQQLQNLENKVKNSKISLPSSYKEKLKEISSIKTQNYWNSKQKLEDIEKVATTSKIEASNLMNNIQNKLTTSFDDIKKSENSLQSTINSIKNDQQLITPKIQELDRVGGDLSKMLSAYLTDKDNQLQTVKSELKKTLSPLKAQPESIDKINSRILKIIEKFNGTQMIQPDLKVSLNDTLNGIETRIIEYVTKGKESSDLFNMLMLAFFGCFGLFQIITLTVVILKLIRKN